MITNILIQRVQSLYSKGVQSDDSRLTPRHIYNKLLTVKNRLTYEKLNKKQMLSRWSYQTIQCVILVKVPAYDCPCIPAFGCSVWRTKSRLPRPIVSINEHMIKSVTSIDGAVQFSETTWEAQKYKSGNKYTAYKPDYYLYDGYMYFTGKNLPTTVSITGLFEDPLSIYDMEAYCDGTAVEDCLSPLDRDFPIDAEDVEPLIQLTIQELIGIFSQRPQDILNNALDDIMPTPTNTRRT